MASGTTLDFETKSSYSITVRVSDGLDDDGNADTAVDATRAGAGAVTDVNEDPAFESSAPTALSVEENTASGTAVGAAFSASDPEDDTLTYSLASSNGDHNSFDISSAGQITVSSTASLDYESKSSYSITVQMSDGKDADGNANTAVDTTRAVTVTVTNAEELPPKPTGCRCRERPRRAWT